MVVTRSIWWRWNVPVVDIEDWTGWKTIWRYNLNRPRPRDFIEGAAEGECGRKMNMEVPEIRSKADVQSLCKLAQI